MKFSKLLVLSALWLISLGASAQLYTERTVPTAPDKSFDKDALAALDKTPQEFKADDYYVLYNKGAMKYFIAGNDYETRASVGDNAVVVYFTQTSAAKAKGDDVYELKNYVPKFSEIRSAFAESKDAIWTDNNGHANRFWKVTQNGEDVRISNVTTEPKLFLGWDASKNDTRTYLLASGDIDWQLFTAPGWKAYADSMVIYNKSEELRAAIDRGLAGGLSEDGEIILNAVGVYQDMNSTIEQMEAQIQAIMKELNATVGEGATAEEPVDVTPDLLVNYDYAEGNNEGWSGDAPDVNGTSLNAEFFNKNFNYYQTVKGARAGVYAVKVQGYYRAGSTQESYKNFQVNGNRNARLMAVSDGDEVLFPLVNIFAGATSSDLGGTANINEAFYVPNSMASAQTYFGEDTNSDTYAKYFNTLFFAVTEGDFKIGLKKTSQIANDWTLFDNWSLQYYGNDVEAYQKWFDETKTQLENQLPEETFTVSTSYLDAFNGIEPEAYDKASVVAAVNGLVAAYDSITVNAQLWLDLAEVQEAAAGVAANTNFDPAYTTPLGNWANSDYTMLLMMRALTNAEIRVLIAEKTAAIDEAKKHLDPNATDVDMTHLLTNADFEKGETGWTGFRTGSRVKYGSSPMPVTGGTSTNTCAEAFSTDKFDLYQEIDNVPVGVYSITVQGFCRNGRGTNAWNNYVNQTTYSQPGKFPVYVYMNDATTPFVSVFTEPVEAGHYKAVDNEAEVFVNDDQQEFPDGMRSAAIAFKDGMYVQEAKGLVSDGKMRFGVKGSSAYLGGEDDNWVIFDNFKLIYRGYDISIVKPMLEEEIEKHQQLLDETMGKTAYDKLTAALNAATQAAEGTDGQVMFNALNDLFKTDSATNASVTKFSALTVAVNNLKDAIVYYKKAASASDNAMKAAGDLYTEITTAVENHTLEDADVDAYVVKIEEAIAALRVPTGVTASDDEPADMTAAINNPGYDENTDGWKGTAATRNSDYANVEIFDNVYDHYQDLVGLPEGTYQIGVQAFYRYGEVAEDYNNLNDPTTNKAFLYGMIVTEGNDSVYSAKPIIRLSAECTDWMEYTAPEGWANCATDTVIDKDVEPADTTIYYKHVANNMAMAASEFETFNEETGVNKYSNNAVIVRVPANGRLRIGLIKKQKMTHDWTLFDNWTLKYFGANSAKEADGDELAAGIENVKKTVSRVVEVYSLDGRRQSGLQKGINLVKMVNADGSVVIRKVRR